MDSFSRIVIKQGAGVPTVPASADHRNGDWIATDIYEGEFYLNTDNGLAYTRNSTGITLSDGSPTYKRFKAKISQTGTNAPTIYATAINTLGIVPTLTYSGVGEYFIQATGLFTVGKTYCTIGNISLDRKAFIIDFNVNNCQIMTGTTADPSVKTNGYLFRTDIDIIIFD